MKGFGTQYNMLLSRNSKTSTLKFGLQLCVFTSVLSFVLLHVYRVVDRRDYFPHHHSGPPPCRIDFETLDSLDLTDKIEFSRVDVDLSFSSRAQHVSELDFHLPAYREVDLRDIEPEHMGPEGGVEARGHRHGDSLCANRLQLTLPKLPPRPDASHMIFGVATTAERLDSSLDIFKHWAAHTGATIVVILEPTNPGNITYLQAKADRLDINLVLHQSDMDWNDRYFALTKALWEQRNERTEWTVLIDDDTLFPNIAELVDYMAAHFDAGQEHYVGGLTEDFYQMQNMGFMAYGGGGAFISLPLMKQIVAHFDECDSHKGFGDHRVAGCIYRHTVAKLEAEPRFHQLDMHGDMSGFYESGRRQPLSIHHWKSWHQADVGLMLESGEVTGYENLLRRWRLRDGWYLVNGFSVVKYSQDLPEGDITLEQTWMERGDYRHSMDPLRPPDQGKQSLRLEEVVHEDEGRRVRQFYVQRGGGIEGRDKVLEIVWQRT